MHFIFAYTYFPAFISCSVFILVGYSLAFVNWKKSLSWESRKQVSMLAQCKLWYLRFVELKVVLGLAQQLPLGNIPGLPYAQSRFEPSLHCTEENFGAVIYFPLSLKQSAWSL